MIASEEVAGERVARTADFIAGPAAGCLLIAMLWLAALASKAPVSPLSVDAPADVFSGKRAQLVLGRLVGDSLPHPIGSAQSAVMRERILLELRALGYAPETQSGYLECNAELAACAMPTNIVALIGRERSNDAVPSSEETDRSIERARADIILMSAHYDSVAAGPGASDDAAGVATLLEIARALRNRPTRHPIVLLFDDGEETGLLGATLFVQHHRWAKQVAAAINVDNRGTSGASFLFETGTASLALMKLYSSAVSRPSADSATDTIFGLMPPRTDFSVFKAAGYQGYNFAYLTGVQHYHTPRDDFAHADASSIQQQGDAALGVALALADSESEPAAPPSDRTAARSPSSGSVSFSHARPSVYFDVYNRHLVSLSCDLVRGLSALSLVLLSICAAVLLRRGVLTWRGLSLSSAVSLLAITASAAAAMGALALLARVARTGVPEFSPYPGLTGGMALTLVLTVLALTTRALQHRAGFWDFWCAYAAISALIGTVLALVLPGVSYLLVFPALTASVGLAARVSMTGDSAWLRTVAASSCLAVTFFLMWPVLIPMHERLGTEGMTALSGLLAFAALPLVALAFSMSRKSLVLVGRAVGVLALVSLLLAAVNPAYTAEWPEHLNIQYESERGASNEVIGHRWVIAPQSGRLPDTFQPARPHPIADEPFNPLLDHATQRVFAAEAPALDIPAPVFQIVSISTPTAEFQRSKMRHFHVRLFSPRAAQKLKVAFAPAAGVRAVTVQELTTQAPPVSVRLSESRWGWRILRLIGLPQAGVELSFDATDAPFDVSVLDASYGLPPAGYSLSGLRTAAATTFQDGDVTIAWRRVQVEAQ